MWEVCEGVTLYNIRSFHNVTNLRRISTMHGLSLVLQSLVWSAPEGDDDSFLIDVET